ncbi:MAG: C39 family peptidase [Oscillospiraceae bacterium]|nr:C39 family peptidase [Oscillospiraceae bacterium]
MFQYADHVSGIPSLGDIHFTDGATDVVYFSQLDERYAEKPYRTDNTGGYACGPTSMAIVVSSLTSKTVDPVEMSKWAYENGCWCSKSGSYHTLIPSVAKAWGLPVEGCTASEPQRIVDALNEGKLVVALMTKATLPNPDTSSSCGAFRTVRSWWPPRPVTAAAGSCGPCPSFSAKPANGPARAARSGS